MAEILACLGHSGLAISIAQLSEAAKNDILYADDGVTHALQSACEHIVVMRLLLLSALGIQMHEIDIPESVA